MMQVPYQPQYMPQQAPQYMQPSYNAVKIDVHNPQVNAPGYAQAPMAQPNYTAPIYNYPQAPVYNYPQAPQMPVQYPVNQAPVMMPPPVMPEPVIVPPAVTQAPMAPQATATATATATTAPVQAPEVKAPEAIKPQVDLNAFIAKLTNPDFNEQANAMEAIADMAQNAPAKATELLDTKVVDALLGIMSTDSSKLQGPSPEQLALREKVMTGKPLTEVESKTANTVTPMEMAERNKQYALYTTAMLQKLYGSEIEKLTQTVVPMTELPGAAAVVEQLKSNPNPMVRAAAVDSLSYIQHPSYKQDLTTLFTIAKTDADPNVKDAATKALAKLEPAAAQPTAK